MIGSPPMFLPRQSASFCLVPAKSSRGQELAQVHGLALLVRQLDADGVAARHDRDAGRDGRHRAGDVVGEADDAGRLGAGRGLELVERDDRAGPHVDDLAADAEILERRFEQRRVLLQRVLRHGRDLLLRLGEERQRRQLVARRIEDAATRRRRTRPRGRTRTRPGPRRAPGPRRGVAARRGCAGRPLRLEVLRLVGSGSTKASAPRSPARLLELGLRREPDAGCGRALVEIDGLGRSWMTGRAGARPVHAAAASKISRLRRRGGARRQRRPARRRSRRERDRRGHRGRHHDGGARATAAARAAPGDRSGRDDRAGRGDRPWAR